MTKRFCNRCGEEIPCILDIPNKEWKKMISNPTTLLPYSFEFNGQTINLCGSCTDEFKKFLVFKGEKKND